MENMASRRFRLAAERGGRDSVDGSVETRSVGGFGGRWKISTGGNGERWCWSFGTCCHGYESKGMYVCRTLSYQGAEFEVVDVPLEAKMLAEKAKEKEELMSQELNKSLRRVEELTAELLEEKEQATKLRIDLEKHEMQNEIFREVIDKFYRIRQLSLENFTYASWEEKCESLMNDSNEMWRFQNEEDTSTSSYINSLEAETENLRRSVDSLQIKLRVGLEIESHFKKNVRNLEEKNSRTEGKFKKQISALLQHHSQYKTDVVSLLDEGYSEIKSLNDVVIEKMRQFDTECYSKSCQNQDKESHESECKDVHISADSRPVSITKSNDRSLTTPTAPETGDYSGALALALHEKVAALFLLSQQVERRLLERNVNAAFTEKN